MKNLLETLKHYLHDIYHDFHAWRRDEVRIVPRGKGIRGRVYTKKRDTTKGQFSSPIVTDARGRCTLTMHITRGDGTVECIVVPADVTKL